MSEITKILAEIQPGSRVSTDDLLPLLYDELKRLAAQQLSQEQPGITLQATALVHEAYLRLIGTDATNSPAWNSRGHFFAAASEAMRRILIESARRRAALKRGGNAVRHDVESIPLAAAVPDDDLLAIDDVVDRLCESDAQAGQLVKLRFFAGLSVAEAADAMGISERSAHNVWTYGRAWLRRELRR